jgi:hypothetical protein
MKTCFVVGLLFYGGFGELILQRKQKIPPDDLRLGIGYGVLVDVPVGVDVLVQQIVAGEFYFALILFQKLAGKAHVEQVAAFLKTGRHQRVVAVSVIAIDIGFKGHVHPEMRIESMGNVFLAAHS